MQKSSMDGPLVPRDELHVPVYLGVKDEVEKRNGFEKREVIYTYVHRCEG